MMKSVIFMFMMLLSFENIESKSFQPHENDFLDAEINVEDKSTPKIESEDRVIWKRIDWNSGERSFGNKEENNSGNDLFTQKPTSLKRNEIDVVEQKIASENENDALKKQPFSDNSLAEILVGENSIANSNGLDEIPGISEMMELKPRNLTNVIVIDFSNITGDALVLDMFNENEDLDEVSEMTKGEEIAFLHEMPTSNFEFLIDSQTRRNILLKELLSSTVLSVEEADDTEIPFLLEHDDSSATKEDSHSPGNKFEVLMWNDKSITVSNNTEVDGMKIEESLNETSQTSVDIELRNSSENIVPECPQPGWCIFWFLSQDTCAVNSHCLGSRICCTTGCSKTCVDV